MPKVYSNKSGISVTLQLTASLQRRNPSPSLESGQVGKPHCSQPAPAPQPSKALSPDTQLAGKLGFITQNDPFCFHLCRGPGYKELKVA